jgi:hypothetical protein
VVLSRFDLWPAALTIGALAAFVVDRTVEVPAYTLDVRLRPLRP